MSREELSINLKARKLSRYRPLSSGLLTSMANFQHLIRRMRVHAGETTAFQHLIRGMSAYTGNLNQIFAFKVGLTYLLILLILLVLLINVL